MRAILALALAAGPALAQPEFYRFAIDQDRLAGAPDFSSLNRPLTAADRIFVRDGHFHRVGPDHRPRTADDQRVRLFGINTCFSANFPAEEDAPRIARRLRRLGINLVRLHHMDSSPDRDALNAGSTLTTGPYPTLNLVAIARLRRFLDALAAEGIYVNLNLHVGYLFRPEVDQVPALPGGAPLPTQSKPLHIFYPRMVDLQTVYARKLIEALKLRDDPVLAMIEIDNESSMVEAWQRGNLERYALGAYKIELDRQWEAFHRNGGSDDYLGFLAACDRRYVESMLHAVRETAGPLVPVAGTQMGYGGLMNLDSQAGLDYQDNHFYIDHYNFPRARWDPRDWRVRDSSAVGSGLSAFLNMAAAREAGRPYTVSEFNQPWPNRQAAEIDPALAAFAAFQDWDSVMHFAYSHNRNWGNPVPGGFDLNGDWSKYAGFGQAAWLFRTGAVTAGREPIEIPVSRALRRQSALEKRIGNIAAALAAAGYDPNLALVHRVGVSRGEDGRMPRPAAAPYAADTGELVYDPARRLYVIRAARAAGVIGYLGQGTPVEAGALTVELETGACGFAAVLLTPLDDKSLEQSARLLLTNPGYTLGTLPGSDPPRRQALVPYETAQDWFTLEPEPAFAAKPSGSRNGGAPPVWMERVELTATLRSRAARLAVYPLDGAGARLRALPASAVRRLKGAFRIRLQADGQEYAPWYEVVAAR